MDNNFERFLDEDRIEKCNLNFDTFRDEDMDYVKGLKEKLDYGVECLDVKDEIGLVYAVSLGEINKDTGKAELKLTFDYISENASCSGDTQGEDEILMWDYKYESIKECLISYGYEVLT